MGQQVYGPAGVGLGLKGILITIFAMAFLCFAFFSITSLDLGKVIEKEVRAIRENSGKSINKKSEEKEDPFKEIQLENGKSYRLYEKKLLDYKKAKAYCLQREGILAEVTNIDEMQRLQSLMQKSRINRADIWVGVNKREWKKHSFTPRKKGPDLNLDPSIMAFGGGGGEMCPALSISTRSLVPAECMDQHPYICEFERGKGKLKASIKEKMKSTPKTTQKPQTRSRRAEKEREKGRTSGNSREKEGRKVKRRVRKEELKRRKRSESIENMKSNKVEEYGEHTTILPLSDEILLSSTSFTNEMMMKNQSSSETSQLSLFDYNSSTSTTISDIDNVDLYNSTEDYMIIIEDLSNISSSSSEVSESPLENNLGHNIGFTPRVVSASEYSRSVYRELGLEEDEEENRSIRSSTETSGIVNNEIDKVQDMILKEKLEVEEILKSTNSNNETTKLLVERGATRVEDENDVTSFNFDEPDENVNLNVNLNNNLGSFIVDPDQMLMKMIDEESINMSLTDESSSNANKVEEEGVEVENKLKEPEEEEREKSSISSISLDGESSTTELSVEDLISNEKEEVIQEFFSTSRKAQSFIVEQTDPISISTPIISSKVPPIPILKRESISLEFSSDTFKILQQDYYSSSSIYIKEKEEYRPTTESLSTASSVESIKDLYLSSTTKASAIKENERIAQ